MTNMPTNPKTQYGWTIGQRVVVACAVCDYQDEHGEVIGFELNNYGAPLVLVKIDSVDYDGYAGSCFYPFELDKEADA